MDDPRSHQNLMNLMSLRQKTYELEDYNEIILSSKPASPANWAQSLAENAAACLIAQ